jgi:hypothetical protein
MKSLPRFPTLLALLLSAAALLVLPAAGAAAKPDYRVFASCGDSKPFQVGYRCGYDGRTQFRATFVFKSNVGKRALKACFRVFGEKPLGGGHACQKLPPTKYKAFPFKITGIRQAFSVKVSWFAKVPGSGGGFKPAGSSFMRVHA